MLKILWTYINDLGTYMIGSRCLDFVLLAMTSINWKDYWSHCDWLKFVMHLSQAITLWSPASQGPLRDYIVEIILQKGYVYSTGIAIVTSEYHLNHRALLTFSVLSKVTYTHRRLSNLLCLHYFPKKHFFPNCPVKLRHRSRLSFLRI